MNQPLAVEIESDFYEWPRIKELCTNGGIKLPSRIRNLFIFLCFEAMHPLLDGTDIAERTIPDATRWIEVQFLTAEAEVLLTELRRHVTPGLVAVPGECTAFARVRWPLKDRGRDQHHPSSDG
jgi:hypothetical protein